MVQAVAQEGCWGYRPYEQIGLSWCGCDSFLARYGQMAGQPLYLNLVAIRIRNESSGRRCNHTCGLITTGYSFISEWRKKVAAIREHFPEVLAVGEEGAVTGSKPLMQPDVHLWLFALWVIMADCSQYLWWIYRGWRMICSNLITFFGVERIGRLKYVSNQNILMPYICYVLLATFITVVFTFGICALWA